MKFTSLPLQQWIFNALEANNFYELTQVQEKTFFPINKGKNIVISAPTGSGKTLCYLLPILNNIDVNNRNCQAILIAPTKELVWQIYNNFVDITRHQKQLKIVLLDNNQKVQNLLKNPSHIVVATVDKIKQSIACGVNFKNLKTIVLDEADMLIDYGFVNQINDIFSKLNLYRTNVQKVFCSASIHNTIANIFKKTVNNLLTIQLERNIFRNNKINHSIVYAKVNEDPMVTFNSLIETINPYLCIIFANTKQDVEKIYKSLLAKHLAVGMLHKDMDTRDRKQVFNKLNRNEFKYLVATDLASRGLDIDGVSDVISYNLPKEDIWYLHRSGRTGRGKYFGNSYVIYNKNCDKQIQHLAKKVDWKYYLLINNKLVEKPLTQHKSKPIQDIAMKKEIAKLYTKKSQKVKPGYKKKIKKQIFKLKQKAKREYLDAKYKKLQNQLASKNKRSK